MGVSKIVCVSECDIILLNVFMCVGGGITLTDNEQSSTILTK